MPKYAKVIIILLLFVLNTLVMFKLGYNAGNTMSETRLKLRHQDAIEAFWRLSKEGKFDVLSQKLEVYKNNYHEINRNDRLFSELFSEVFIRVLSESNPGDDGDSAED